MLAAVLEGVKKLVVKEVPTPRPFAHWVLVRVKACGICLTDYKAYSGERTNVKFPAILGHEFSGVVEEIGEGVNFFTPGEEVVVSPVTSCGVCQDCRRGFPHYCRYGAVIGGDGMDTVLDGAWAQYVVVPENTLYQKPAQVSFEAAALTEPLAGSYKGLIEYSRMKILAFQLCRRGTRVNEFGVTTEGFISVSPRDLHFKETRVDASFSVTPRVMQASLALMEKGLIDPALIITHTFPLEEIGEAMKVMEEKERVKIVIKP